MQQQIVKLDTQARQALSANREDLARVRSNASRTSRTSCRGRPADLRPRDAAAEADRFRGGDARQARGLPHQEGGHQGAVLGAERRCGSPRLRPVSVSNGRRRDGDAARARQDRGQKARAGRWASSRIGHVRRPDNARARQGRHRSPARAAQLRRRGRRRAGEDEGRAR